MQVGQKWAKAYSARPPHWATLAWAPGAGSSGDGCQHQRSHAKGSPLSPTRPSAESHAETPDAAPPVDHWRNQGTDRRSRMARHQHRRTGEWLFIGRPRPERGLQQLPVDLASPQRLAACVQRRVQAVPNASAPPVRVRMISAFSSLGTSMPGPACNWCTTQSPAGRCNPSVARTGSSTR
jgi:hypothetical protein